MASVDSVQSSNAGAYTLGGAALGAVGGGAYGYFSKPWLKDGAPNDAFYKTAGEKMIEEMGEDGKALKKAISNAEAIINAKNADELAKISADQTIQTFRALSNVIEGAEQGNGLSASLKESFINSIKQVDDAKLPNKAELIEKVNNAKALEDLREILFASSKTEIEAKGFEVAKKEMVDSLSGIKSVNEFAKSGLEEYFDASKKEFKLNELAENGKKAVTETMSSMKKSAALKWAAIGAAALGVVGFIVAKCTGKSGDAEPVAAAKIDTKA